MEPTAATFFVPLLLALSAGASVQQPELPPGAKALQDYLDLISA